MEENEFDVSDLAWLTYKVLYRTEIDTMDKGRLHAKFRIGETIVNMSGETDFNFITNCYSLFSVNPCPIWAGICL